MRAIIARSPRRSTNEDTVRGLYLGPDDPQTTSNKAAWRLAVRSSLPHQPSAAITTVEAPPGSELLINPALCLDARLLRFY